MRTVIGIDVGTSGTKGLLVGEDGKVKATAAREYGMATPRPAWAEQDPADWKKASFAVIAELVKAARKKGGEVAGVGLTGQMHSAVFLDRKLEVIRPAILWCDGRTKAECELITRTVGFERLVALTANRALEGFTAPKVLWLRRHEPRNYRRFKKLLLAKDYIRLGLTGELATDVSDASGMLLFDVARRAWSADMLELLELDEAALPACFESPEVTGQVTREAARATGLAAGTPVVAGGGDQAAGAVGNGVVVEGPVLITIGTSGVVFAAARRPVIDPRARLHSFCHASPGLWHVMGVMLAAGGSIQWLRNALRAAAPRLDYPKLNQLAEAAPPGADGLWFLPYLTGERTPHFDPDARGAFVGLALKHGLGHLVRATMEGVAYGLADSVAIMRESGARIDEVLLSGGGAKSDLWSKIVASVIDLPIKRLTVDEGPSFGAAALALVGIGAAKDVGEVGRRALSIKDELEPDRAWAKVYKEGHARFRALYPALRAATSR